MRYYKTYIKKFNFNYTALINGLNKTIIAHKGIGKKLYTKEMYNDKYKGAGDFGMVNALRGTINYHDGQWKAWLAKDLEIIIDLEKETLIHQVLVGTMESQKPGIYFHTEITVFVSN